MLVMIKVWYGGTKKKEDRSIKWIVHSQSEECSQKSVINLWWEGFFNESNGIFYYIFQKS